MLCGIGGAGAQSAGSDLGATLIEAQHFTVKVRATVVWPIFQDAMGTSFGTGFIIDRERGWILTNAHVARRSPSTVEIAFGEAEDDWLQARRLYVDNHLDVAVLVVDKDKLPERATAAKLGCKHPVKQGATVVAYGHPINLNFTATRGIVSSVRTLRSSEIVQMDANINPGNSGGPLLAADVAEVIGINTANIPGAPGLGIALAIRHVCPIIERLIEGTDPSLPSLPIYWLRQGLAETLTVAARFPQAGGEPVADGLQSGDVVQGVTGGPKVASVPDLYMALRGRRDQVSLDVLRDGRVRPVVSRLLAGQPPLKRQMVTVFGMLITERTALDSVDPSLPPLRIEFIKSGEGASRIGLQSGDQIVSAGDRKFANVADLYGWLAGKPAAEKVTLLIRRFSLGDPRINADYYRFEIQPTDLRLLSAGE